MKVQAHGLTDVGRKRKHNEDTFLVEESLGLYVVADGMGGHAAGEVASAQAVEVVRSVIAENAALFQQYAENIEDFDLRDRCQRVVEKAIQRASAQIFAMAQKDEGKRGMGTTCVLLVRAGPKGFVGHVGDSRVYLLRNGQAYQLTEDHTLVNAQLKQGLITREEAEKATFANVITRSVGYQESVQVDTLLTDLLPGDRFLLCSDGLSGYVKDDEWAKFLAAAPPDELPPKLVQLANHRGGKDNITVVVLSVEGARAAPEKAEVEARMEVLRRIPLFKHLKYKELIQVLSIVRTERCPDGTLVIEEDTEGDRLFVMLRGKAEVLKGGTPVAEISAGQHFGEMALIDNAPRSATVRASQDSTLLSIDRDNFYGLMRKDPVLAVKLLWSFLQVLTGRLRATNEELTGARGGDSQRPMPLGGD
jgi:PPM family protein phosphatase